MTALLGSALISRASLHVERYAIGHADVAVVDDTVIAPGTSAPLAIGTLSLVGGITSSGDFGGQARHHWSAGVVGIGPDGGGAQAWSLTIPARPYHDDGGIMLSAALADLERDAATAAGASPLGTALEVPDMRLDAAGSWIRPRAIGRDLLDALALAAGLAPGAWWVAADGSTHLGSRPSSSVTLSDLTVDPFDPALVCATVRIAGDDFAPLLPGATLSAPGLPSPLPVGTLLVTVDGDDISAEIWGEASHAELLSREVRHVMAAATTYATPQPYSVASVATDGRVAVTAPPGATFPDAPLLGHAPGIPGASFVLAPGAPVLVSCVGGSPGAPVCVAYPPGTLPVSVLFDASGTVQVGGGGSPLPLVVAVSAAWFAQVMTALGQIKTALGGPGGAVVLPTAAPPSVTAKATGA